MTKLETRRASKDCTESSATSLTRRVTILAFGSGTFEKVTASKRERVAAEFGIRLGHASGFQLSHNLNGLGFPFRKSGSLDNH